MSFTLQELEKNHESPFTFCHILYSSDDTLWSHIFKQVEQKFAKEEFEYPLIEEKKV